MRDTVRKELGSDHYDAMYESGGAEAIYDLPYWHSGYYPLFRAVWNALRRVGGRRVLEVGCGSGAFAHLLLREGRDVQYRGFDFSPVAVDRAVRRTARPDLFFVGDARSEPCYAEPFDTVVCTEVLEHIDADLEVIGRWPAGTRCICSVPNFDADSHVRFFGTVDEVRARYGGLIEIDRVIRIKKPFLYNISWANRLRALRWNRYRPQRLLDIVGLSSFEDLGGWYLFTGVRRAAPSVAGALQPH